MENSNTFSMLDLVDKLHRVKFMYAFLLSCRAMCEDEETGRSFLYEHVEGIFEEAIDSIPLRKQL